MILRNKILELKFFTFLQNLCISSIVDSNHSAVVWKMMTHWGRTFWMRIYRVTCAVIQWRSSAAKVRLKTILSGPEKQGTQCHEHNLDRFPSTPRSWWTPCLGELPWCGGRDWSVVSGATFYGGTPTSVGFGVHRPCGPSMPPSSPAEGAYLWCRSSSPICHLGQD